MTPRVSILTPMFNAAPYIVETAGGVLAQRFADFEWIVVDDGSTDDGVEKIEQLGDPRVRVVRAPHSGLPACGRNLAWTQATGELIALLDADDVWLPEKLAAQVDFLDAHPEAGLVHSAIAWLVDGDVCAIPPTGLAPLLPPKEMLRELLSGNRICTSSVMLRRSVLPAAADLFDPDPRLRGPEDFDLWLRLAEQGVTFGYLPETLVHYRLLPNSVTRHRQADLQGTIVALENARSRCPGAYQSWPRAYSRRLGYLHLQLGIVKLASGAAAGWQNLRTAAYLEPFNLRIWAWMFLGLFGAGMLQTASRWRDWLRGIPARRRPTPLSGCATGLNGVR